MNIKDLYKHTQLDNTVPVERSYQSKAILELTLFIKELLREITQENRGYFSSASLLEMATGSGKTFTVGRYAERLINSRNKSVVLRQMFGNLRVVLISNRIDGVTQFRDDLLYGRSGKDQKSPILSQETRKQIKISTYHSRADGEDLNDREELEIENVTGQDEFIFSTWQTANEKDLASKIPYADIVIIDEAHNVRPNSDFFHVIEALSGKGRNGKTPLILPITATPTNVTKELFGEPVFTFGIGEYLASGYAPNVEYHVITGVQGTSEEVKELVSMIRRAKEEQDFETKEILVKEARELFDALMAKDVGIDSFVGDILDRLKEKTPDSGSEEIEETIIFARSIHDADMIAREMNEKSGIPGFSLSYHSQNDDNEALRRLTDPSDPCRVVVAVDKLNESIDLPVVRNIVFYRYTQDPKIYLQQFGRGLRGNGVVRYYDYIGGMENFSWIGQIQEKYSASIKVQGNNLSDPNTSFVIHTQIPGIVTNTDTSQSNLTILTPQGETDKDTCGAGQNIFADHIISPNIDQGSQAIGENIREGLDTLEHSKDHQASPSEVLGAEFYQKPSTFYDTEINVLDETKVKKRGVQSTNVEDISISEFSGKSHFVNLADLGLMVHNLSREIKEQLDVSDEDLKDFFLNISGIGDNGSYERWKTSYYSLLTDIKLKHLKEMKVKGIPLRRVFATKGIKTKYDVYGLYNPFFKEFREQEEKLRQLQHAKRLQKMEDIIKEINTQKFIHNATYDGVNEGWIGALNRNFMISHLAHELGFSKYREQYMSGQAIDNFVRGIEFEIQKVNLTKEQRDEYKKMLAEEEAKEYYIFLTSLASEIKNAIPDLESIRHADYEWTLKMNEWNQRTQTTKKARYEKDISGNKVTTFMKRMDFYRFFQWVIKKSQEFNNNMDTGI